MDEVAMQAGVVKHVRLMPPQKEGQGRPETSVCRSSGLGESQIWHICTNFFDPHSPKRAIGRGKGLASTVYAETLSLDPNGDPYPEHAEIVGWPYDPARPYEDNKHVWKIKAQKMAEHFRYEARPTGL